MTPHQIWMLRLLTRNYFDFIKYVFFMCSICVLRIYMETASTINTYNKILS